MEELKIKPKLGIKKDRKEMFVYSTQEELTKYILSLDKEQAISKMIGLGLSNLAFIKRLLKREPIDLDYILENLEEFLVDYKEMNDILTNIKEKENK